MRGFKISQLKEILSATYYGSRIIDIPINNFEFSPMEVMRLKENERIAFISISRKRWNKVHRRKTSWYDGNKAVLSFANKCDLIITEHPIPSLKNKVPQLIVDNSFTCIRTIARAAREKMSNPVIAITGSVGKSSTRLMIEHLIKDKLDYVATRGNHNTQSGVPLYGAKLCTNPDLGILEVSLNALNNRGNQSLTIQPDIVVLTSIGEAHLSTLHTTKNIARLKGRIFAGLKEDGLVILNKDMGEQEFTILKHQALQKTNRIKTYSLADKTADMYVKSMQHSKYESFITITYREQDYRLIMEIPSEGMVMNMLAALLTLGELGYDISLYINKIASFRSLDRIMQLKQISTVDGRKVDLYDDSHNAAIPSMKNAINTFKQKAKFYRGKKILVLGQVADLGNRSEQLHHELIPGILTSRADYIFGHGPYMRAVIRKLPQSIVGGWFNNVRDLAEQLPLYCTNDSLVLIKGSVSGSDFQTLSKLLPIQIQKSKQQINEFTSQEIASYIQPVLGAISFYHTNGNIIKTYGYRHSKSIEGLGAILFLKLLLQKGVNKQGLTKLSKWPTNRGKTIRGKPYKTNTYFSHKELLEELIYKQHPSAIFELARIYFGSRNKAMQAVTNLAHKKGLHVSAALNLTGRYRVKEQQAYYLEDVVEVAQDFEPYRNHLRIIAYMQDDQVVRGLVFGNIRHSIIAFYKDIIICAIGLRHMEELEHVLLQTTQVPSVKIVI